MRTEKRLFDAYANQVGMSPKMGDTLRYTLGDTKKYSVKSYELHVILATRMVLFNEDS